MKPQILFIDDEPNILRGLQRLFRSQRESWDMEFLSSGAEALTWLEDNNPFAIITDMRMPSIDGGAVLSHASMEKRGQIRLVLSGEADRDLTFKTVGASHQFFAKPCCDRQIISAVTQAYLLGDELLSEMQRTLIANLPSLPSPQSSSEALETVFNSGAGLNELIKVIARDPALAVRILQLANSSYFGRPGDTLSIAAAVKLLGMDVIRAIWEKGLLAHFSSSDDENERLENSVRNALESARRSYEISQEHGASDKECEDAYAISLLSWMGDAIAASNAAVGAFGKNDLIAASSYIACIYGLPQRTTLLLEMLANSPEHPIDGVERAEELGAVLFENRRAA